MDILVIDDEPRLLMVMRLLLEMHHRVVAVSSAHDALRRLAEGQRFDLILCDLMMPGMTGADFHLEVSTKAPEQADDIVFMSGGIISARVQEYLEQIPNLCLDKPFSEQTLLELIHSHVA
jgi:CheY-like chemotaxis protein